LIEAARRGVIEMICPTGIAKYFCKGDWTTQIKLNRLKKLSFSRTRFPKPQGHASEAYPREMIN
jgi:hypothetical protein